MSKSRTRAGFLIALSALVLGTGLAVWQAPLNAAALQRSGTQPYSPGNGVSLPAVVKEVKPEYPEAAKNAKVQGEVELSIVVLASGDVGSIAVVRSLDREYGVDDAAIAAARQWRFTPGMKDGKPVDVRVTVAMRFTLK